ncbi:transcription factor bHLH18-like [Olea europaea subsp. europaea]|uniref:Transcription factor bHLH18-like n=1 Tax=Olea europaea subsp. europaea TaxID=158383 RepID=A0A8S0R4U6_OLEEU|nr:transcription factor bHLH18-like [Olea europaea subsp. europaea]
MDVFDEDLAAFLGEETPNILYPESNPSSSSVISRSSPTTDLCPSSYPEPKQMAIEPPSKQKKPNNHHLRMPTFHSTSSTPIILNFSNVNSPQSPQQVNLRSSNQEEKQAVTETFRNSLEARKTARTTKKTSRVRPPSQTYDHIIAERKRREQLSQLFVALSTIVPGLKKMDRTSILGDAIKYLKNLQDRVNSLEDQVTKQTVESVIPIKRSEILVDNEGSIYEKNSFDEQILPEIEAEVCENLIHLRIHIKKHKGYLLRIIGEIEKLNLTIDYTNVTPFGNFALDISITAQLEKDSGQTVKEIVRTLGSIFQHTP